MLTAAVPIAVQVVPVVEYDAVKLFPERVSLRYTGAATPATTVLTLVPPVAVRLWKVTPLAEDTNTAALIDPAAVDSRTIKPALAHALVLVMLLTRAISSTSPLTG